MADEDWRGMMSASQCLDHLCLSDRHSDVTFGFHNTHVKLRAHRFVLSMRSAVFEAMFYGPLSGSEEEITLTDTDPETFKIFLKYLYTDKVALDGAVVSSCLYLARKYCVDRLVEECSRFLRTSISPENACTIYQQAVLYDLRDLEKTCMDYMINHDRDIFNAADLCNLSRDTLREFLASDDLSTEEHVIFTSCLRWAKSRLLKEEEEVTQENVRTCLGDAFYNIRFPLVPIETFAKRVSSFGVLTAEEEVQLYRYIAIANSDNADPAETVGKFSAVPRGGRTIEAVFEKRNQQSHGSLYTNYTNTASLEIETSVPLSVRCLKGSLMDQVDRVHLKCFNKDTAAGAFFTYTYGSVKFEQQLSKDSWTVKEDALEFAEKLDIPVGISRIILGLAPNYTVAETGKVDHVLKVKEAKVKIKYSTYISGSIDAVVLSK